MELIKTEKKEHSIVEFTINVTKAEFEAAKEKAYKEKSKNISVPGFRKGKVPRRIVEKMYGEGIFIEDAFEKIKPDALETLQAEVEKAGIDPVGRASYDVEESSEPGAIDIIFHVPVWPEVTLGQYKGLEAEKEMVLIPETLIDAELERLAKSNARTVTVEREARDGDTVDIDFDGFIGDEPFEGGYAEHYMLTLGSGTFIPGFEDQLIGCKAGDKKDVAVTFPENYNPEELAGKDAVFKCTVHRVDETIMPEIDDEFAKDVSDTCETLDDLKKEIEGNLRKDREEAADNVLENKLMEAAVANMTADIPEAMYEAQIDRDVQEFSYKLSSRGLDLERFLGGQGIDLKKLRESFREQAVLQIKCRVMLETVAKQENITVSDSEIEEEYADMAEMYGMEAGKLKENIDSKALAEDIKVRKALELIKDQAVITMVEPKSIAGE